MAETRAYDLLVLIDTDVPEERRAQMVEEIRKQIQSGDGALKGDADWGTRKLTFEIDHHPEAYYHLFQFEAAPTLLDSLRHSLSIDDAVLRHRILRLPKGAPDETPRPAPPRPAGEGEHEGASERDERGGRGDRGEYRGRGERSEFGGRRSRS